MNLIVIFDSSDWVGADLGKQTCSGRSRSHTAADALGAPMGCGDNRNQPRPARSGQSVCWGRLVAFGSDLGGLGVTRERTSSFW